MIKKSQKILVVSATRREILPFIGFLKRHCLVKKKSQNLFQTEFKDKEIYILITGVGIHSVSYELGKWSDLSIDWAINAGIAGAFDKSILIGEVVIIKEEFFSELGVEDGREFLRASVVGLGNERVYPKKLYIPNDLRKLRRVRGITVNTVHGGVQSIKRVKKMFQPQVETMEGAAFYYACNQNQWRCVQIRSVSNYVEKRNKEKWNIPLAIQNLNQVLIQSICQ